MAKSQSDWVVEQVGSDEQVTVEVRYGEPDKIRLTRDEETVDLLVDGGIAKAVDVDELPEWVENVAARLGIYEVQ